MIFLFHNRLLARWRLAKGVRRGFTESHGVGTLVYAQTRHTSQ